MVDPDLTGVQDQFQVENNRFNNPGSAELVTQHLIISVQKNGGGAKQGNVQGTFEFPQASFLHRCNVMVRQPPRRRGVKSWFFGHNAEAQTPRRKNRHGKKELSVQILHLQSVNWNEAPGKRFPYRQKTIKSQV